MTSGGLSSVLAAYDQCVISLAIWYGVSWIHYSMLYGSVINPSMLDGCIHECFHICRACVTKTDNGYLLSGLESKETIATIDLTNEAINVNQHELSWNQYYHVSLVTTIDALQ